jgi:hypothetical protein
MPVMAIDSVSRALVPAVSHPLIAGLRRVGCGSVGGVIGTAVAGHATAVWVAGRRDEVLHAKRSA